MVFVYQLKIWLGQQRSGKRCTELKFVWVCIRVRVCVSVWERLRVSRCPPIAVPDLAKVKAPNSDRTSNNCTKWCAHWFPHTCTHLVSQQCRLLLFGWHLHSTFLVCDWLGLKHTNAQKICHHWGVCVCVSVTRRDPSALYCMHGFSACLCMCHWKAGNYERQVKCFKASLQWNPVNSEESLGLHYSAKTIPIILLKWSRSHLLSFWEPKPNQCLCFCLFCADWNNTLDKKVFIGHI